MATETITEDAIWADIDAVFAMPARQPGDVDAYQIMSRYGGNENTARNRMTKLVSTGEWEFVYVADDTTSQGRRKIIRKVDK
jgi:hypothetical protein